MDLGDQYTTEQLLHYPSGEQWHAVSIFEFRDGKIVEQTSYFAAPFPVAEWRSPWVEMMDEAPRPDRDSPEQPAVGQPPSLTGPVGGRRPSHFRGDLRRPSREADSGGARHLDHEPTSS